MKIYFIYFLFYLFNSELTPNEVFFILAFSPQELRIYSTMEPSIFLLEVSSLIETLQM